MKTTATFKIDRSRLEAAGLDLSRIGQVCIELEAILAEAKVTEPRVTWTYGYCETTVAGRDIGLTAAALDLNNLL